MEFEGGGHVWNFVRKGCVVDRKDGTRFDLRFNIPTGFDAARWSSLNPLSIAWELAPLSFVVDYFVDIGDYLRNVETALLYNANFVGGYTSRLMRWECSYGGPVSVQDVSNVDQIGSFRTNVKAKVTAISFQRSVMTSYPFPYVPKFQAQLGSYRLATLASLLAVKGLKPESERSLWESRYRDNVSMARVHAAQQAARTRGSLQRKWQGDLNLLNHNPWGYRPL
jgi:hypothetical protein